MESLVDTKPKNNMSPPVGLVQLGILERVHFA